MPGIFYLKRNYVKLAGLALLLMVLWLGGVLAGRRQPAAGDGGWVYSLGDWYWEKDGERLTGQWVADHTYFVDENGKMVTDEWICEKTGEGGYVHTCDIPSDLFPEIDMSRLSYVGHDGKIIRNKTIYFTPFKFDGSGRCSISEEDVAEFENLEYGIEGFRRYVVFYEGYREYY